LQGESEGSPRRSGVAIGVFTEQARSKPRAGGPPRLWARTRGTDRPGKRTLLGVGVRSRGRGHGLVGGAQSLSLRSHVRRVLQRPYLSQCASPVPCPGRVLFAQVHLRWSRLECRAFLSEVLEYFGSAASRCMIDASSVGYRSGTDPGSLTLPRCRADRSSPQPREISPALESTRRRQKPNHSRSWGGQPCATHAFALP
jgi:hypothetical protein